MIRFTFSFKTDGGLPRLASTIMCLEQVVVITERAFSQSHLVPQLHPFLDNSEATHALVTSQLNIGLLLKTIQELQLVQNAIMPQAAHLVLPRKSPANPRNFYPPDSMNTLCYGPGDVPSLSCLRYTLSSCTSPVGPTQRIEVHFRISAQRGFLGIIQAKASVNRQFQVATKASDVLPRPILFVCIGTSIT